MCLRKGAPIKPAPGPCNETHGNWVPAQNVTYNLASTSAQNVYAAPTTAAANVKVQWTATTAAANTNYVWR
jgi:hypothetical protein